MANTKIVDWAATILVLVGSFNWGLFGLFDYNLVEQLIPTQAKIAYIVIGAAAVYSAYALFVAKK